MRKGEIEDRLDPDMILYRRKLLSFAYPVKQLKSLTKAKPQYGSNQAGIERDSGEQARYIRITDINEYGLLKNNLGATAEFVEEKYLLNDNDVLFARSGATVGKAYLHKSDAVDYECFFAGYMIRFLIDENLLLPDFLFFYTQLEVYKDWKNAIQRAAGQPNINAEEYNSLPIPVPPIEIQTRIIEKFEAAYRSKRAKETEAKSLLDGIDAYLLERLGIETPAATDAKRFFYRRLNEVTGNRFDANSYNAERLSAIEAVKSGKYSFGKLKSLTDFSKTIVSETDLPYIGMENIESNTGNYIETSEKESFGSAVVFSEHQILFPKLRPYLNKVYYAEFDGVCSTEFHILDSKIEDLSNEFLSHFLRSRTIVSQTKHLMSGNTLPRLQTEDIENLLIPLPPLEVQEEIAAHVQAVRQRAKELEHEAKREVEQAKREVERMILGAEK